MVTSQQLSVGLRANCTCSVQRQQQQQYRQPAASSHLQGRRQLLAGLGAAAVALGSSRRATATGLESVDLPPLETPEIVARMKARNQKVLDDAEAAFQNSDLLRVLKDKSEANRDVRKRELFDKYCARQAELGVGDCGGLRYIPGMTKSGVQKRPDWLNNLLGLPEDD